MPDQAQSTLHRFNEIPIDFIEFLIAFLHRLQITGFERMFQNSDTFEQIVEKFLIDVGHDIVAKRGFAIDATGDAGRYPYGGAAGRHIPNYDGVRTDLGILPDGDIAQNFGTSTDDDVGVDGRMAFAPRKTHSAERHLLIDQYIISDYRCFADDNSGGMIDKNPATDLSTRMDIDGGEKLSYRGDEPWKKAPPPNIERMTDPIEKKGPDTRVVEKEFEGIVQCRIVALDGAEILSDHLP